MRKFVLQFHRWTGMTLGIVLLFVAGTGTLIAYRQKLEPIVNRDLLTVAACGARVSIDTLAANARAVHPEGELDYVRVINASADPARTRAAQVRVRGKGFQDDVFLDPCTGAVLGQRARYGGFLGSVEGLHKFRFIPNGQWVSGTAAFVFVLVFVGGGLYLWWPRGGRSFSKAMQLNTRLTGRARTLDRHRIVGIYAGVIALFSALTGLPQAFDWLRDDIYWITGSPLPDQKINSKVVAGAAFLSKQDYWQRIQSLAPEPREALIHFPLKPDDPVEAFAIPSDAPHANARTLITLDAYSGAVLNHVPYAQSSLGHRIYFWSLSWHDGALGGLIGPLVLMTGTLGILFLGYTGASSFLGRQLQRRAKATAGLAAAQAAAKD